MSKVKHIDHHSRQTTLKTLHFVEGQRYNISCMNLHFDVVCSQENKIT